jgi:hypothetical protein
MILHPHFSAEREVLDHIDLPFLEYKLGFDIKDWVVDNVRIDFTRNVFTARVKVSQRGSIVITTHEIQI